ncbi:MAG: helix-turn-helix domain-containing protein [Cyanobacteriota bacterium]|nr:helix-turn-helix domain-containing protein [Cyanobacteriota bacterium]
MDTPHCQLWATARQAREHLGISERTLARWRGAGLLKPGKHWRREFPSPKSPVLYNLPACEDTMGEATARSVDRLERAITTSSCRGHVNPNRPPMSHR